MMKDIIFKTLMLKGEAGSTIVSMEKTGHAGTTDTYTITFDDGSTKDIYLENLSSVESISLIGQTGVEDIYTVTLADGSTQTFSVLNHINDIENMSKEMDAGLASIEAELNDRAALLNARMDTFTSLPSGSTSGNAELIDLRVGANGETYDSAGTSVRTQFSNAKSDIDQKISAAAIENGYVFDYNSFGMWEQGSISTSTGASSPSTAALYSYTIRTKGYISNLTEVIKCLNVNQNYRFEIYKYTSEGVYVDYTIKLTDFIPDHTYRYRIVVTKYETSSLNSRDNVSVADYNKVGFFAGLNSFIAASNVNYDAMINSYISDRAMLFDYAQDLNTLSQWEQGRIDTSSGNNINSGTLHPYRIRTAGFVPENTEKIVVENGYIQILTYASDGTFEASGGAWVKEFSAFVSGKKYRLNYSLTSSSPYEAANPSDCWGDVHFLRNPLSTQSDFKHHIAWTGGYAAGWYEGKGTDYSLFDVTSTYADLITAYDAVLASSNGYMTKESIGTASDGQTMYAYRLTPTLYRNITIDDKNRPPIVMIVPSQHGFEKSASYGTFYFVRDLVQNFYGDPALESMRSKCCFIIIPCANPWGFDNRERKNYNGVDLNRNWGEATGSDQGGSTDPDSAYYAGEEPFDQPETQAIKAIIDANPEMFYLIDFHTNGGNKAPSWDNVNWISMLKEATTDKYYIHAYYAANAHISAITENMLHEYDLDSNGDPLGNVTVGTGVAFPTLGDYVRINKIMGHTFEGNNGFPSEASSYSGQEQKANSELVGNFIKTLLLTFSCID